jgi:hypothetical protein
VGAAAAGTPAVMVETEVVARVVAEVEAEKGLARGLEEVAALAESRFTPTVSQQLSCSQ